MKEQGRGGADSLTLPIERRTSCRIDGQGANAASAQACARRCDCADSDAGKAALHEADADERHEPGCAAKRAIPAFARPMRRRTRRSPRDWLSQPAATCGRCAASMRWRTPADRGDPLAVRGGLGGIEDFLHAYSLSTQEGLALMVLAEALLRVPDAATADRLIEDKLVGRRLVASRSLAATRSWSRPRPGRSASPRGSSSPARRRKTSSTAWSSGSGLPAVRLATRQAMRLLGSHFVLGQTIDEALERARSHGEFRYSFDMLGEGARTAADAERYFEAYADAIDAIGRASARRRCRSGRAFRSSCRRCIRATRRSRASA